LLKGHPLQALSLMQRFCRTNRKDAEAHHLLGMAYEAIGQGDRALAAYDVAATLDPEDAIVRISLEDAVAARESPRRGGASRRTAGTQSLDDDVHRGLAQGAPSRSPSGGAASDDGDEPGLLDRSAAAEEPSDRSGPLVQIVPVDVSSKGGADEDQAWSGAEASDELSADDDTPLRLPRLPSASPVRWAYELEVGHVKPAGPQRLDDRQPAGDETEAADINDPPR
jgi:tetratricopeptide (TPR) repeat protein